ncbi:hypothetical protein PACTADRAFT_50650 [Pachysolen tannophilus NRRL Y-2460]|uniref:Peroxisomal ATPase PEX6 n=1 Tax=Pachysolen tannophilus NRRL Y-2460 TaxID=669874 RepID=A0A1E4TSR0_PACTA|nr:hypothetical protein PACTADRAFT_50650 [Pachysolen tannophilus NRRL Y-2460]
MPALIEESKVLSYKNCSQKPVLSYVIFNQNPQLAKDHINISPNLYSELYGTSWEEQQQYPLFASIKLIGSSLFKKFETYQIWVNSSLPSLTVEFNNVTSLMDRFSGQMTVDSCLISAIDFRGNIPLPAISRVYISFPDEVYELLSGISKDNLYQLLKNNQEYKILRTNDYIENLNGKIIFCDPISQGLLTEETNVTVVRRDNDEIFYQKAVSANEPIIDTINLNTLDYLSLESSDEEEEQENFPKTELKELKFNLKSLLFKINNFAPTPSQEGKEDDQIFGFVKINELNKIGCFSGDYIKVRISTSEDTDKSQIRTFKVFSFLEPNEFESNTIYLSSVSILNLYKNLLVPNFEFEKLSVWISRISKPQQSFNVPIAKQVNIARVSSPITLDRTLQHLFLSNLKSFFEVKNRVVYEGQLIPIPIDTILARSIFSTYETLQSAANTDDVNKPEFPSVIPGGNCDAVAWFKVTEVVGDNNNHDHNGQYIIDSSRTRMIQSGIVTEAPPILDYKLLNWYEYLGLERLFQFPNVKLANNTYSFQFAKTLRKLIGTSLLNRNRSFNLQTTVLLSSASRGIGKSLLVKNLSIELGVHLVELDAYEVLNPSSDVKTIGTLRGKLDRIVESATPLIIHLRHIEAIAKKVDQQANAQSNQQKESLNLKVAELIDEYSKQKGVIFIVSTSDSDCLSDTVRSNLRFEINLNVPTEFERKQIFRFLISVGDSDSTNFSLTDYQFLPREDLSFDHLALQSAGLTPRDLSSIVGAAKSFAIERFESLAEKLTITLTQLIINNGGYITLTPEDFDKAIGNARSKFSDSIGAPRIPDVKWEDVGGLDMVKDEILDTIDMPLRHPHLFNNGLKKRSGILFYGPPGTGKTLLAKAIATNFALNFFSVKGPELLNMYIGESEANVRKVFQKARDAKPCVVFFDELDSVAPKRGNQGDSGGVMDRIVSQLLAELDGMSDSEGGDGVFVVGATNRPDLLDEALLRPGRFDKMLYLGIPDTHTKQTKILEALTRKFQMDSQINLSHIAGSCPFHFTGADFYALCSDAMLNAMTRTASDVDRMFQDHNATIEKEEEKISLRYWFDNIASSQDVEVLVKEEDFIKARNEIIPSVSAEELDHYLRVRQNFEGSGGEKIEQKNHSIDYITNGSSNGGDNNFLEN